ncbi:uncharacterized protein N7483_010770 [Penicillium malachiteum]|uniref:uncharacterized protein n=1 Tax=Penicillium malachiteum TaxID=1324776 RepID=UPI0025477D71|nr:uncharacterized protein N7483_010770 [Penicillium malachiteum]KAJ5713589.1 hypothetical protein N7483_010770 [Penicillium malachiteum]
MLKELVQLGLAGGGADRLQLLPQVDGQRCRFVVLPAGTVRDSCGAGFWKGFSALSSDPLSDFSME